MTSRPQALMASSISSMTLKPNDTFASKYLCAEGMGREFLKAQLTAAQPSQLVQHTLQMIGGNLPVQSNLFKWGKAPSPRCLLCPADREGFSHVQCWCPALKEVRIQVHHSIWTKLLSLLREHAHDYLFWREAEIQSLPTLCLAAADQAVAAEWRRAGHELERQLNMLDNMPVGALDTVHSRAESWGSELEQGLVPQDLNGKVIELRGEVSSCRICPKELKRELYAMLLRPRGAGAERRLGGGCSRADGHAREDRQAQGCARCTVQA